jgi:molybdenum cofactor biosynthesis protein B
MSSERSFVSLAIAVLTVSDSRTEETDSSGRLLVERLTAAGHRLAENVFLAAGINLRASL